MIHYDYLLKMGQLHMLSIAWQFAACHLLLYLRQNHLHSNHNLLIKEYRLPLFPNLDLLPFLTRIQPGIGQFACQKVMAIVSSSFGLGVCHLVYFENWSPGQFIGLLIMYSEIRLNDFSSRIMWSWNRDCHPNGKFSMLQYFVTADLYEPTMDEMVFFP